MRRQARILLVEAGTSDIGIESMINPTLWTENIGSDHDYKYLYAPTPRIDGRTILLSRGKILVGRAAPTDLIWARASSRRFRCMGGGRVPMDGVMSRSCRTCKKIEDWEGGATEFRGAGGPIRIETAKSCTPLRAR